MQILLDQFDREISSLINTGNDKEAVNLTSQTVIHTLSVLYGLYLRKFDHMKALCAMQAAEMVDDSNPMVQVNLSYLYSTLGQYDLALKHALKGVNIKNPPPEIYYNLGLIYKNLGKLNKSAQAFSEAVKLNSECALTHCQFANVLLALGRFEEGLKEDEWRFKAHSGLRASRIRFPGPDWDGKASLAGKRVIVYNEQGLGDGIHFARYLPCVKKLGAYVILEIQEEIAKLIEESPYVDEIILRKDYSEKVEFPQHDYVIPMGSFMYFFDPKLDCIPMDVPYLYPKTLNANEFVNIIRSCNKFKIGIIWAGSPWHTNDNLRSIHLKYFKPLSDMEEVQLFSLQKGNMCRTWMKGKNVLWEGNDEYEVVNLLDDSEGIKHIDLSGYLKDFNDTAQVLKELDVLVAVDTSTSHLAGALGLNVILLLPWAHEWRWLKNWYPTMRLIKQPKQNDWQGCLMLATEEIRKML